MSVEFDLYLKPCSSGINLELANAYSPYGKPFHLVGCNDVSTATGTASLNGRLHAAEHDVIVSDVTVRDTVARPSQPVTAVSTRRSTVSECSWTGGLVPDEGKTLLDDLCSVRSDVIDSSSRDVCATKVQSVLPESQLSTGLHRKLSLPARLISLVPEADARATTTGAGKLHRSQTFVGRRRYASSGVRFADEIGENLTTFSIIPSRFDNQPLQQLPPLQSKQNTESSRRMMDDNINKQPTSQKKPNPSGQSSHQLPLVFSLGTIASESESSLSSLSSTSSFEDAARPSWTTQTSVSTDDDITTACRFRMSFDQPAADPLSLQHRLNAQMVCLENVKVVQSRFASTGSTTSSSSSSSSSSVAVLCTVKVKHLASMGQQCCERRLFARWTDNDWQSYADISAQCIFGVGGSAAAAGFNQASSSELIDTYSFAVHVQLGSSSSETTAGCHENGGRRKGGRSKAAVEFALCYIVDRKTTVWDNNNGQNYRIEWF